MIRLLFIINNLQGGGAEHVLASLTSRLNSTIFDISVLALSSGVAVKFPDNIKIYTSDFTHIRQSYKLPAILSQIKKMQPDIIHSHLLLADWVTGFFKLFHPKVPVISTIHGYNFNKGYQPIRIGGAIHKNVQQKLYKKFNQIISVSDDLGNYLHTELKITGNLHTIYNGLSGIASLPKFSTSLYKPVKLLYIGSLRSIKNVEFLIKSLSCLPDYFRLTVVGDGPLKQELIDLSKTLGLDERVSFTGYKQETTKTICEHHILIIPSLKESFSLTTLQGLLVGIPVLASDVGGIREVFSINLKELMFCPTDQQDLIMKIQLVVDNYENILDTIRREKPRLSGFSVTAMTTAYELLYKSLIGKCV